MTTPKSNKIKRQEKGRKERLRREREQKEAQSFAAKKKKEEAKIAKAVSLLSASKAGTRNPKETIKAIYNGEKVHLTSSSSLYAYKIMFDNMKHRSKADTDALYRLLLHLVDQSAELVDRNRVTGRSFANAVSGLVIMHPFWMRRLEDWKSPSYNSRRQFNSLVRHLLAKYHVPHFMDDGFFSGNHTHQNWFLHVGKGNNIRTASGLPIPLTKKAAHYMMTAPSDFDINAAIRWGQIKFMGGDERMIRAVLKTRIGNSFAHNEFWESVFRWFMDNPMLDTAQYAPLIDYIYHQKFVPEVPNDDLLGPPLLPAQPNISMKKRSVDATIKAMESWHKQVGRLTSRHSDKAWGFCGIPGFSHTEGEHNKKVFTITELISTTQLREEGLAMSHCVGSYSHSCASGRTSVWSLKEYSSDGMERKLTIEVDNQSRSIRQARGRFNARPCAKSTDIMNRWATEVGLTISRWLV